MEIETVLGTFDAPHQVPLHPGLPGEEHRGFPAPLPLIPFYPSTLLISIGGSTPLLCLEWLPELPVAPQDEAGLTTTFQTWPRGCFHIAKHRDFPFPLDKNSMPRHLSEFHPVNEVNT